MATILIADDSAPIRRMLHLSLAGSHTVIQAADGAEALALLRQHRPDVAVLDVVMPGLHGLEVCRLLRADPELLHTGVIVISANAGAADAQQAGADRFLPKPFLPSALLAAVNELVRSGAVGVAAYDGVGRLART